MDSLCPRNDGVERARAEAWRNAGAPSAFTAAASDDGNSAGSAESAGEHSTNGSTERGAAARHAERGRRLRRAIVRQCTQSAVSHLDGRGPLPEGVHDAVPRTV